MTTNSTLIEKMAGYDPHHQADRGVLAETDDHRSLSSNNKAFKYAQPDNDASFLHSNSSSRTHKQGRASHPSLTDNRSRSTESMPRGGTSRTTRSNAGVSGKTVNIPKKSADPSQMRPVPNMSNNNANIQQLSQTTFNNIAASRSFPIASTQPASAPPEHSPHTRQRPQKPSDHTQQDLDHLLDDDDGITEDDVQRALAARGPQQSSQSHFAPTASPARPRHQQMTQASKAGQSNERSAARRAVAVAKIHTLPSSESHTADLLCALMYIAQR